MQTAPPQSFITPEELLRRERPQSQGGHLLTEEVNFKSPHVIVHISNFTPFNLDPKFVQRAEANFRDGIRYSYFVPNQPEGIAAASQLIRAFVFSPTLSKGARRVAREQSNPTLEETVTRNLGILQGAMRIFPVGRSMPFDLRVHNPGNLRDAACYLEHPKDQNFLEYARGSNVSEVTQYLQTQIRNPDSNNIVQATISFEVKNQKNRLLRQILTQPEEKKSAIRLAVSRACFGSREQ